MRMIYIFASLGVLAACSPEVPDSAAGVGFDNYDKMARQTRDVQLIGGTNAALPPTQHVSSEPLDATNLAAQTQAVLAQTDQIRTAPQIRTMPLSATAQPAVRPTALASVQTDQNGVVQASPANAQPLQLNNPGISDENDFNAVGQRRSIESDAQRRASNQAQYKVIEPTALPSRSGTARPNIVAYALQTSNSIGQRVYRRIGVASQARFVRNCKKYGSPDVAQTEFLSRGGPQKDRLGLDPDGDGYACNWDPRPFRMARSG